MIKFRIYKILKKVFGGKGLTKYSSVRDFKQNVEESVHSEFVIINGNKLFLDSSDSLRLSLKKEFEPKTTDLIQERIFPGNIVIDIGANIGFFTLIMADIVKKEGKVFSFEPESKNFQLLEKNVKVNNLSNVILENKAVGNINGETDMYLASNEDNIYSQSMHRIYSSNIVSQNSTPVKIKIIRLDDFFEKLELIEKIDLIKIDVEGAEFDVLKGMSKILDLNKDLRIIMEFSIENLQDFGSKPDEVMDFLLKKNFRLWKINEIGKKIEEIFNIDDIKKLDDEQNGLNIFCQR
tara:strand:- start:1656 stop:2534 length:879 start_codon:yes stop_codon:yes gene_type:complete